MKKQNTCRYPKCVNLLYENHEVLRESGMKSKNVPVLFYREMAMLSVGYSVIVVQKH